MPADPSIVLLLQRRIEIRKARLDRIRTLVPDAASQAELENAELDLIDARLSLCEEMRRP